MENYESRILKILCLFGVLCAANFSLKAQSTNQGFPTAITSNEISGKIAARDIGDARLTAYYYVFGGRQGDVFINVQTSNFNGDIDIFTYGNLKPLSKITIYADDSNRETGRVVYLRQPAKLILRIEGRSPNDDAATFSIKFAGSFEPSEAIAGNAESETPEVKSENQTDVRVNSVGTILEVKPKTQPSPKAVIAKKETKPRRESQNGVEKKSEVKETGDDKKEIAAIGENISGEKSAAETGGDAKKNALKTKIDDSKSIGEEISANSTASNPPDVSAPEKAAAKEENSVEKTAVGDDSSVANKTEKPVKTKSKSSFKKVKAPNPLENVRLIILLKDGTRIERAMSEITKVGVDGKGILTVIASDGSIKRYSILDVARMTIE